MNDFPQDNDVATCWLTRMIHDSHDDLRRLAPELPAGAAPDALQRLAAAPAFDRPPGAAQVAMRRPAVAPASRRPAGAADAALRRPVAAIGLLVAEPAAKKPRTFASSVQELQELKALKDSGVIDDNELNQLKALLMSEIE